VADEGDRDRVEPDLIGAIDKLADTLDDLPDNGDVAQQLERVVDLLILRGHLLPGHRRQIARHRDQSAVTLGHFVDKRRVSGPAIDCASLMPICHSRCCTLTISLSVQDLVEGKLTWDIHAPYRMTKNKDTGYCNCTGSEGQCTVYDDRPGACRAYDCRNDPRIWKDFDNRIPAELPEGVVPLGQWKK
jgi:hypothetical protein